MLNAQRFAIALRVVALVCLLCIPYTDLGVERAPRAMGDHAMPEMIAEQMLADKNAAAAKAVADKRTALEQVAPALAQLEADLAATPMKAILRNVGDNALNIFYMSMTKLVNLNPEVFNLLVDRLPPLADNAALDADLRQLLKNEFRKSGALYSSRPQDVLAKTALQVLVDRLDTKQQAALLAAQTPDLQKKLLEQLLRERLMEMNQPLMGMQPTGAAPGMGRDTGDDMVRGNRTPSPAAGTDRRMRDLARTLNTPKTETATAPAKKEEKPDATPAKKFELKEEQEKVMADKPVTLTPPAQKAAQAPQAPGKKSTLPPVQDRGQAYGGAPSFNSPPAQNGMMPMQAGFGSRSNADSGGDFPYQVTGEYTPPAARQRFNYLRANSYLGSNGEETSEAPEGESEIASSGSGFAPRGSAFGTTVDSAAPASSAPAFSKPMELTLSGLCVTGALDCGRK
jgi:hypothetical protein